MQHVVQQAMPQATCMRNRCASVMCLCIWAYMHATKGAIIIPSKSQGVAARLQGLLEASASGKPHVLSAAET